MLIKNNTLTALLTATSLLLAGPALAEPKWAVGASSGLAHYDIEDKDVFKFLNAQGVNVDLDEDDLAVKLWGSYQFSEFLLVQAQWVDLGETSAKLSVGNQARSLTVSAEGLDLGLLLQTPVADSTNLFIKLSAFTWDQSVPNTSADDNGTNLGYGFGFSYTWEQLLVRAEYEGFDLEDYRVDVFTLGAGFRF